MEKRKYLLVIIIVLAFAGSYIGKMVLIEPDSEAHSNMAGFEGRTPVTYARIVSLAPSITEALFALGLGDRVIGVTRFCDYPPEALNKEKIGGYCTPNYEAIVVLGPDLVIILPEHEEPKKFLAELGMNILEVNHRNISGILKSIATIGKVCGAEQKAREIIADIDARMNRIKEKTDGLSRQRVMVSIGRNMGSGSLKDVYISGKDNFYDEMITLAGGQNAYNGRALQFPIVSTEGILRLNPEVIIDMIPDLEERGWDETTILKEWNSVSAVDAAKNNRVHVFGQDYTATPGPRFILILEKMARVIHPEVKWE